MTNDSRTPFCNMFLSFYVLLLVCWLVVMCVCALVSAWVRVCFLLTVVTAGYSADDALKMNGKINFFANRLGEHDHVLKFIGAVLNSSDCTYS